MSLIGATILTAKATVWLAILAAITAVFALGAFAVQFFQLRDQLKAPSCRTRARTSTLTPPRCPNSALWSSSATAPALGG